MVRETVCERISEGDREIKDLQATIEAVNNDFSTGVTNP